MFTALSGAAFSQSTVLTIAAPSGSSTFGQSTAIVGDVNGDGVKDIIVGDAAYNSFTGRVNVYSGATGGLIYTYQSGSLGYSFGKSVAGVGDINLDGRDDFIVGAPQDQCDCAFLGGFARVYSGINGSLIYQLSWGSESWAGWAVSAAGDANADGVPDFMIGIPGFPIWSTGTGRATVRSGADSSVLYLFSGAASGDFFGGAVSAAGDVDLDGRIDFAVGSPQSLLPPYGKGYVSVYSGATGSLIYTKIGDAAGDALGYNVASAGDVDRDGRPDLLVGAPGAAAWAGKVKILSGATGNTITTFNGMAAGDALGLSIAGCGDSDLDGYADFAIGSPFAQVGIHPAAGRVDVISGRLMNTKYSITGTVNNDGFGAEIDGGADINLDSFPELLVGNPSNAGAAGATVISLVPVGLSEYSFGTPGCNGFHRMLADSVPNIGNNTFGIVCDHAPQSSLGLLIITNEQDIPGTDVFSLGILMHCGFVNATELFAFDIYSDDHGFGLATASIPNNPNLIGNHYYGQSVWAFPAPCGINPFGLSSSRGLAITIQ